MIEWMVIERLGEGGWHGLGSHNFHETPRQGEIITFNNKDGWGEAYEVIAVAHHLQPGETAGDLIIKLIGLEIDWRKSL